MLRALLESGIEVTAHHELGDEVWLSLLFAQVQDGHNIRVRAQAAHRPRFAPHSLPTRLVQPFSLDQCKGHVAIEQAIVGSVHPLLAALAEEVPDLIATAAETSGNGGSGPRRSLGALRSRCGI